MKKHSKNTYILMMKKVKPPIAEILFFGLLVIGMDSIKFFLSIAYENVIESVSDMNTQRLITFSIIALVLIIISGIALKAYAIQKRLLEQRTIHSLQQEQISKKMEANLRLWEKQDQGEWMTNLTSDCKTLAGYFANTQTALFSGILQFGLAITYGFSRSPKLTIAILLLSLLSLVMPRMLSSAVGKSQQVKQMNDARMRGIILDGVNRLPVIKAFMAGPFFVRKFSEVYKDYSKSAVANVKAESKMNSLNIGIGFLMNTLWMIYGIYLVMNKEISAGVYIGFMNLGNNFNWPFFQLSNLVSEFTREKVAYERLYSNSEIVGECGKVIATPKNEEGILVDRVSFSYSDDLDPVLEQESYMFHKGKKTAIVGESGKGKTTLLKLMMGLYNVDAGEVALYCNGSKYTEKYIRDHMSYVPQGYSLFAGTIRDNIAYGREGASFDEIKEAARKASAEEFILELDKGYDTEIGTGSSVNLSQGQAIRIALARAFLKQVDVFVLDEVTSALDTETEDKVLANIKKYANTVIMVAHKKKAIDICEDILQL